MKIYPYNMGSASAKALAEALGIKRIKHDGKALPIKERNHVINWGASRIDRIPAVDFYKILNHPAAVKKASNKLETFKALDGVCSIPEWTESREEAVKWLEDGSLVVCREKLNGHSGKGIVLADSILKVVNAPLYTKYIPKAQEYRLHVFQGEVFFVQRKARKKEIPDEQINWKVRNHANGFIFAHNEGVELPGEARNNAILAVAALGLDFGAVDMIYNQKQDKYYVLEVNTACGLEGETLNKYVEQFKRFL